MYEEKKKATRTWLLIGLGVVAVVALVLIFIFKASKPEVISAPTAFVTFTAPDKSFACEAPSDWQRQGMSLHGTTGGARFEKGAAKIAILADLQGSLMGDIARATSAQSENFNGMLPPGAQMPKQKPPVEALHEAGRKTTAEQFEAYEEQPAQPFNSRAGEARFSEWTAEGGRMTGKLHGYRATLLNNDRLITVFCQAPEGSWKALQPAFSRIIGSIAPGTGG